MKKILVFSAFLFLLQINTHAQKTVVSPAKGSPERKILLDLIRVQVEKTLGIEVIFEVKTLKMQGGFAFGDLTPRQKDGQPIDYTKTRMDPDQLDAFDDWICVLWQQDQQGNWSVRQSILGATDLPYGCWWKEFKAPKAIFTYTEAAENCISE